MPELADVEGFRRYFARYAVGKRIARVTVGAPEILRNTSPQGLGRALAGERFGDPRRRGKWLIAPAADRAVVFHFGMTGDLDWHGADPPPDDFARAAFHLDEGVLRYRSQRKLGGIWLADGADEDALQEVAGALGPDADRIDRDAFVALLDAHRKQIKSLLMDQARIAGLGNELADEVLWRAGVRPDVTASDLGTRRADRLFDAMRDVLRAAKRHGRIPVADDWLRGQREADTPRCPRCGRTLERSQVGGRTTLWCRHDQRAA